MRIFFAVTMMELGKVIQIRQALRAFRADLHKRPVRQMEQREYLQHTKYLHYPRYY